MLKHFGDDASPAVPAAARPAENAGIDAPLWPAIPTQGGWLGTYPAELALGALPWPIGAAAAGTALGFAGLVAGTAPGRTALWPVSLAVGGALLAGAGALSLVLTVLYGAVHHIFLRACRRRARAWGLHIALLVPEHPALARYLHRLRGLALPRRGRVYSIHVDTAWRGPRHLPAAERRGLFGRLYAADYDRVLSALAGSDTLVCSSTFNRHESPLTARAAMDGWRLDARGPLFPWQPRRHGPRAREREQRQMFGVVVTGRRVDRPGVWRVRVFDCARALPCAWQNTRGEATPGC